MPDILFQAQKTRSYDCRFSSFRVKSTNVQIRESTQEYIRNVVCKTI